MNRSREDLRKHLREQRTRLTPAERASAANGVAASLEQLPEFLVDRRVAGYWAVGGELPLIAAVARLNARGQQYCLAIVGDDRALRFAPVKPGARRAYVFTLSPMEGRFSRRYKGAGHPHTNMAKAALNMMTRTSAGEMFETDRILMTAVDTGWITDERPHHEKLRIAAEGWHAPLDLVDGAARVYDPVVRGEAGEDVYGVFLKDYAPGRW